MYTQEFTVQPSDASCSGRIKLKNLLDYFQNTAGIAVEDIEGTTSEFVARGYAWVLTRYEIEFMGELPSIDEKFTITTFHDPSHGYNTLRVFDVRLPNGKPIIFAKTSWLLLDLAAGRPVKAVSHLPEIMSRDTGEISPDFYKIPDVEEIVKSVEIPVRFHDLDYNSHVNNAVYFSWLHDETPINFTTHSLKSVYASFRSGAKFGEKVTLEYGKLEDSSTTADRAEKTFACRILRENVSKPCANFLCTWKEINA